MNVILTSYCGCNKEEVTRFFNEYVMVAMERDDFVCFWHNQKHLDLILQLSLRDVGVKFLFQYVLVQMFSVDLATVLAM